MSLPWPDWTPDEWRAKTKTAPVQSVASRILKFNPYHDAKGRFATATGSPKLHSEPSPQMLKKNAAIKRLMARVKAGERVSAETWYDALSPEGKATVDNYVKQAEAAQAEFKSVIEAVAAHAGSKLGAFGDPQPGEHFYGPLKTAGRIAEKAFNDYGGDVSRVTDVLRMTYVVKNADEARDLHTKATSEDHPTTMKDRFTTPSMGYRDVMFKVRLSNGMMGEIQGSTRELLQAKEGSGHKLYEQMRVSERDSPAWKSLVEQAEALYASAWEQSLAAQSRYPKS